MGNLTRDPELRVTPGGLSICKITIASTRVFYTQDNQKKEETAFVDIDCFGKQAENVAKYFSKGKPILVEGRLKYDTWDDKTSGQKRSKLGVVMEAFEFVGGRDTGGSQTEKVDHSDSGYEETSPPARSKAKPTPATPEPSFVDTDDVPF